MKKQNNNIWVSTEDLTNDPSVVNIAKEEFFELPVLNDLANQETAETKQTTRRDFLKYLGFGLGAATLAAGCDIPTKKVIPYVVKPDEIVPGVATYYASSFVNGGDYCAILVKTREGRPIKIEGNAFSSVTMGGTSARAQASVLSLYDKSRLKTPVKAGGTAVSWDDIDKAVAGGLNANSTVRIIASSILSPTTKAVLEEFKAKYPNTKVVMYDAVSSAAMLQANEACFGQRVIPNYNFQDARVIVSFNADFLGTWISPVEYAGKYAKTRKIVNPKGAKMSRHIQFESHMSLTGSNADNRVLVKPSEQGAALVALYNAVAAATGGTAVPSAGALSNPKAANAIKLTAKELVAHKGQSLVIAAANDVNQQKLVNKLNALLGNYGKTIDLANYSLQRQGDESEMQAMLKENVDAIFVIDANPVFDLPNGQDFAAAIKKAKLSVSFAGSMNETAAACQYVAPTDHFLEAWGDAEPKAGQYSLIQPTISPLFDTRPFQVSLLKWAGSANLNEKADQPYYEYLKAHWVANMMSKSDFSVPRSFWDATLHDGVLNTTIAPAATEIAADVTIGAIAKPSSAKLEVTFFETVQMGAGQYADNPWLQEMPDPVTRCVWGNHLAVPITWDGVNDFDGYNDLKDGDIVNLTIAGKEYRLPIVRQFGQMQGTAAVALGYGRTVASLPGKDVGANIFPAMAMPNGLTQYSADADGDVSKSGKDVLFACVQHHHTMGVTGKDSEDDDKIINVDEKALGYKGFQGSLTKRTVIRQANFNGIEKFADGLKHEREHHQKLNSYSLYPGHKDKFGQGHHWGMAIDLNACIGCGACQVACIAENNVPVVGKREVMRHHEMTWLRIDRYYYGDVENPNVVYQPMMCQHCDNAPCENVCPVAATNHSSEGLNQMTYNRCIGTRYCANNCPYKVRRFNWLDYTTADLFPWNEYTLSGKEGEEAFYADNLVRMVLNPDVTVRSRGVIEKCSFCVQRLQEGKLTAKKEGRRLNDNDVKTACQTACPTGAITFGDINDKKGAMNEVRNRPLSYAVLEEINTQPSVAYLTRVNNRDVKFDA